MEKAFKNNQNYIQKIILNQNHQRKTFWIKFIEIYPHKKIVQVT